MKAAITTSPASTSSRATSPARRRFSARSSGLNPRSLHRPLRKRSPSRTKHRKPDLPSSAYKRLARVVLPEAESPVNHKTKGLNSLLFSSRSNPVVVSFIEGAYAKELLLQDLKD